MLDIRTTFSKSGCAKYISHLDLMRCMQRAMKRAKIHVWYTEGFNPHAYIMFPLALTLGVESKCEIMDFRITDEIPLDEIKVRLNSALPEDLQIVSANYPIQKHTEIAFSEYIIEFRNLNLAQDLAEDFNSFISQESIMVKKHNKKKMFIEVDIKPFIFIVNMKVLCDTMYLTLQLPSGTQTNINPNLIIEAFKEFTSQKIGDISIERTKILCSDGKCFS